MAVLVVVAVLVVATGRRVDGDRAASLEFAALQWHEVDQPNKLLWGGARDRGKRALMGSVAARGADAMLCLGDLGAFGPNPDKVFPLLREHDIPVVKGNYDDSIARGLDEMLAHDGFNSVTEARGTSVEDWL